MKNENSLIGLFQGMSEENFITFNPGWDSNANKLENVADKNTNGPASFVIHDPDGYVILIDEHV